MTTARVALLRHDGSIMSAVVLASALGFLLFAGRAGAAEPAAPPPGLCYPTAVTATGTPPPIDGQRGSRVIAEADRLSLAGRLDDASAIYTAVLASATSSTVERGCAARGLATISVEQAEAPTKAAQRAGSRWDAFFADWVRPTLRFGVPALVVFVVLLAIARAVTRLAVRANTPGADPRAVARNGVPYWAGVGGLAVAATTATVGLSAAVGHAHTAARVLEAVAVVYGLALVFVLTFGFLRTDRKGLLTTRNVRTELAAAAVLLAVLWSAGAGPPDWIHPVAVVITAALLAAVCVWVVARVRGAGLAIAIEGKGLGDQDAIAPDAVGSRLRTMGTDEPRGPQLQPQPDVTSLPDAALSLVPDGMLAKALTALKQLFQPSCPWRLSVTRIDPTSVSLVLTRNGIVAETASVRLSELGLHSAVPSKGDDKKTDGADPNDALLTAAAAFALVQLSRRHRVLQDGLYGATDWRSVAAQAIATEPGTTLDIETVRTLLAYAVAFDAANLAALAAWVYRTRDPDSPPTATIAHAHALRRIYDKLPKPTTSDRALAHRLLFNLAVTWANYAQQVSSIWGAAPSAAQAAGYAYWYATTLRESIVVAGTKGALDTELLEASHSIPRADAVEPPPAEGPDLTSPAATMLVRYERACERLTSGTNAATRADALAELALATRVPGNRVWARTDPSLRSLWTSFTDQPGFDDARRFKTMVGDPPPKDLLALPPFDQHRDRLRARGLRTAERIVSVDPAWLSAELHVVPDLVFDWQRLAILYLFLDENAPKPRDATTGVLSVLLGADIDSIEAFRVRVRDVAALHDALVEASADVAVVVPSTTQLITLGNAATLI